MPLKKLPVPKRNRSVGERIVQLLELAALVRTVSRVLSRGKRGRIPKRGGLLAILGGGLLAAVLGVVLAKRKSGDVEAPSTPPAAPPAPTETAAAPTETAADTAETDETDAVTDATNDTVADADPVPAAVDAAKKLDTPEDPA